MAVLSYSIDSFLEFNPNLGEVTRATRVAYVKFMRKKMAADEVSIADVDENKEDEEKKADTSGVSTNQSKDHLS